MTRRRSKRSRRNILMQGAIGDRLCWYPLAQRLHVVPVTPSLHGHWPVVWLHVRPDAPTGWHSHSVTPNQSMKHNTHIHTHTHTHTWHARGIHPWPPCDLPRDPVTLSPSLCPSPPDWFWLIQLIMHGTHPPESLRESRENLCPTMSVIFVSSLLRGLNWWGFIS